MNITKLTFCYLSGFTSVCFKILKIVTLKRIKSEQINVENLPFALFQLSSTKHIQNYIHLLFLQHICFFGKYILKQLCRIKQVICFRHNNVLHSFDI